MNNEANLLGKLGCPKCNLVLCPAHNSLVCPNCAFKVALSDGVAVVGEKPAPSYFDDKFEVMQKGHHSKSGEFLFCYEKQLQYIEPFLRGAKVIVDVGCGPGISYNRGSDCQLIGLDPSFDSIRVNKFVDLRVCGSAVEMPFQSQSIDAIICCYSVHHMVGWSVSQTRANVRKAFQEFVRVLKPSGDLFIAEMCPGPFSWLAQRTFWNLARQILRGKLDQFFWAGRELAALVDDVAARSQLKLMVPAGSPWLMIPPIFSLPWFKLPRFMFPLHSRLFHWTLPAKDNRARLAA